MATLAVFLTDALRKFEAKGEIKPRYYNPGDFFSDVHFFTPARADVEAHQVQTLVGRATLTIHSMGKGFPVSGLSGRGRLARLLRSAKPVVIRAYDPGARGALAVVWGRRLGIPVVVSVHCDLDDQRRSERRLVHHLRRPLEAFTLRRADRVVCVSHHVAHYARRYGSAHVEVIYNRVDTKRFAPAAADRRHPDVKPVVLSVMRLVAQKAPECLIHAMQGLDARLVLIGDGERTAEIEALVDRPALRDRVELVPAVPHRDISRYYASADVFAIASHYEGFCIPVLEAMASGLPVVASDIAVIREVLGGTGLVVPNRPDCFREALRRLLDDPALRAQLSVRARARAVTLDGARMEAAETELYRSLLGGTPSK
ncbi:MAG: glycosyltransferase [Candidatus Rokubacteria bacterium]|nr:glycosyltransferase [Candidatus Rokubacteria bacterium]